MALFCFKNFNTSIEYESHAFINKDWGTALGFTPNPWLMLHLVLEKIVLTKFHERYQFIQNGVKSELVKDFFFIVRVK